MVKQVERLDDGTTQPDTQIPRHFSTNGAATRHMRQRQDANSTSSRRWMFWGLTGILVITVLTLLGATLSLLDPLTGVFSSINHKQGFSLGSIEKSTR